MEQVEIVRKTREIFEVTGVIPNPERIDPSLKPVDIDVLELANTMLMTPWKDLPRQYRSLRGFFTQNSWSLFRNTMLTGNLNLATKVPTGNNSDRSAPEVAAHRSSYSMIRYSEELHKSSQTFLDLWPPSKTLKSQVPWICVHSAESEDESPYPDKVSSAWRKICAEGFPSLLAVDKLAEEFNVLSGKWLIFVPRRPDTVDNLWAQIVESTLAGTLGTSAKVSARDENDPTHEHVICVYNADYRSVVEVYRIRDELRRLGVTNRIAYKPDIYTHCGIFKNNSWGIGASRYYL